MRRRMIVGLGVLLIASVGGLCFAADTAAEVPKGNPKIATASWAEGLKQHPRLLGTKDYLKGLAKGDPQGFNGIKQVKEKESAGSDPFALEAVGMVQAVEGTPAPQAADFVKDAMAKVNAGVTNVHQDTWLTLNDVALTYDLYYDQITPSDRAKIIAWFNGHLGKYVVDENAFHNSTLSKILAYLRVAYATWGDNPRAKEFRDYALTRLYEGKVLPVIKQFGAGGGYTEGGWYMHSSLWHLVTGLELARRFEKYDGFAMAAPFFYKRMAYELYQPFPGFWMEGAERYDVEGDGSNVYGGHDENPRQMRTLLAQYFRGSDLAGFTAAKQRRGVSPATRVIDFWVGKPDDPAKPLDAVPLAHLAEGIGRVYARSDWTDDAAWLRFDCGPYFTDHQHFEVGNFSIFRHEPLATESGEYMTWNDAHAVNYLARTVAHNCILVYDRSEKWNPLRGNGSLANDGGQSNPWGHVSDSVNEWMSRRDSYARGQIIAYDSKPEYLFVAANCTGAYAPTKVGLWVRQIVFLRPGTFVIFDKVVSRRADFAKAWLLHCRNEPEISGSKAIIKSGRGEMSVETLLPKGAKISTVKGYKYPAFAGGTDYPAPDSSQTKLGNLWRMEVAPAKPAEEDLFLHVISTSGPVETKLVQEGQKVSVQVGGVTVTFSGRCGGEIVAGGKKIPLAEKVLKNPWE